MKKIRKSKKSKIRNRTAGNGRLSVCMVVKNEEERIAGFLAGMRGLADEAVVVDTGSEDGTIEAAQTSGARVVSYPWNDDFSEVRNISLQHATGDWVLAMDADEAIHSRDFAVLRQIIRQGNADAYRLLTRNYSNLSYSAGWTPCAGDYPEMEHGFDGWYPTVKVRLFRRKDNFRFKGCVHELVERSVFDSGGTTENCLVPIHHFGAWDTESRKEKGEFYLRLGQKKVAQQPRDPRAHFELGIQYLELGNLNEAEAMLRRSVAYQEGAPLEQLFAVYHSPSEAHTMLGVVLERLGRFEEAEEQYWRAVERNPKFAMALTNWGLLLEKNGKLEKAYEKYLSALSATPGSPILMSHLARIDNKMNGNTLKVGK